MTTWTPFPGPQPQGWPHYEDVGLYMLWFGMVWHPWEMDGWKAESMAFKEGCYIHAGLSYAGAETVLEGPDALEFQASLCINGFTKWPIGKTKHLVMLDDNGLITQHNAATRDSEDRFRHFVGGVWPLYKLTTATRQWRVKAEVRPMFLHQIAGPTSLTVLERATGESLRDLGFLRTRPTQVNGIACEVSRIGMAGTLAYELRGPLADGPAVYDAVYEAGQEFGIKRMGWLTYTVNHVEAGFPQKTVTFQDSTIADPGYAAWAAAAGLTTPHTVSGSVDPANMRARFRTPVEVGWGSIARFDHDFLGRVALEAEVANPKRTVANLRWNPDDVVDIYASLFRPGEEYKTIDLPTGPVQTDSRAHADHVTKDGREVGYSSGSCYSYYYREMISQAVLDIDQAQLGNEVVIHWGDFGRRIKEVRATVVRYPYLDLERNDVYDISKVPSGVPTPVPAR